MAWMTLASSLVCLFFACYEIWARHPALHFVLLPLAALLWLARRDAMLRHALRAEQSSVCRWLAAAHLVLALAAFVLVSPFLAGIAFFLAVSALAAARQSPAANEAPSWALPALALFFIPPPMMLDQDLHQILAGLAARLSQAWLDAMGVLHVVQGTIVATPEKRFFVDDACSGTHSMLAAISAAVVVCALQRRAWPHAVLMILTAGLLSVASNVLRICLIIGSQHLAGIGLDHGWRHEAVGLLFFLLDLALVCSADHGWHFVLNLVPGADTPRPWARRHLPVAAAGPWFGRLSALTAMVGMVMILGPEILARAQASSPAAPSQKTLGREEFHLPGEMSGWVRAGDKPVEDAVIGRLGVRNQVWLYRKQGLEAFVAVNFPFLGFHDTRLCYNGQGWQFQQQTDTALPGDTANTVRFLEMNQPTEMTRAHLWLSVLDEHGVAQPFLSENPLDRLAARLSSRWTRPQAATTTTYVLQVLAVEPAAGAGAGTAFTELLAGARQRLAAAITHRHATPGAESE